jgi:HEAT repeat protein
MLGVTLLALVAASGCGHKSAEEDGGASGPESAGRKAASAGWPLSYWQPRLADKDPTVRVDAAKAIGRMRSEGKAAVPDLIKLLDDQDLEVRIAAACSLGRIGPDAAAAVPALAKLVSLPYRGVTPEMTLRIEATAALGSIGPQAKSTIPELANLLASKTEWRADIIYALWALPAGRA